MVGDAQIILHQALHGYRDGHRILNQSIEFSSTAAKTLLVMSDASGPNFSNDHPGYITGYPVPDTKFYALAKTWPAIEQPRPGCVWTHTILINLSDVGVIKKTTRLLKFFNRPGTTIDIESYSGPIVIDLNNSSKPEKKIDSKFLDEVLLKLYSKPSDPVLIDTLPTDFDDSWIVSIWDQQWPRLKRTFRFCTLSLSDRSVPDVPFDLQIIPNSHESRTQWKNHPEFRKISLNSYPELTPEWIQYAVRDITSPEPTTFRDFLWRYGADTEGGRTAFATLAKAWIALESHRDNPDYDMAANTLIKFPKPIPTLTKYLVSTISKHIVSNNQISNTTLHFLANNVSQIAQSTDDSLLIPLAEYIWSHNRDAAWELLKKELKDPNIMTNIFARMMTVEEALVGASNNDKLLAFLITQNTELAGHPEIWQTKGDIFSTIVKLTKNKPNLREKIVKEMIAIENPELATSAFQHFGKQAMESFIAYIDKGKLSKKKIIPWLNAAALQGELLFPLIGNGKISKIKTLSILSTVFDPCHTYSESNEDCWVNAVDAAKGDPIDGGIDFCVFLLARSLCRISPETSRLAQLGFEPVYNSESKSGLDYSNRNKIRHMLPHALWFMDWDFCYRISAGVARLFVDQNIPGDEFLKLTTNNKLFGILVDRAKIYDGGPQYLMKVLEDLPKKGKGITKRRRILDDALNL